MTKSEARRAMRNPKVRERLIASGAFTEPRGPKQVRTKTFVQVRSPQGQTFSLARVLPFLFGARR